VWKDTTKLGCAVNRACTRWVNYVCQYQVAGNLISPDWRNQVLRAVATPATPPPPPPALQPVPTPTPAPLPALPAAPTPASASGLAPELQAVLDRHNKYRARHQVRACVGVCTGWRLQARGRRLPCARALPLTYARVLPHPRSPCRSGRSCGTPVSQPPPPSGLPRAPAATRTTRAWARTWHVRWSCVCVCVCVCVRARVCSPT
jgi:hypothetical protein